MKRDVALMGMVFAAVMVFFTVNYFVGDGTLSGWNGFVGEKNGGGGVYLRYETYEAVLGDYRVSFDYLPGMKAFEPVTAMSVMSQDFASDEMDFVTITVIPADMNADKSRPRTAEEYEAYDKTPIYGDIASDDTEAEDYASGEWTGFSYHSHTEYVDGLEGYTTGYHMFCGDDYVYVFSHRSDRMPVDIKNLRIERR